MSPLTSHLRYVALGVDDGGESRGRKDFEGADNLGEAINIKEYECEMICGVTHPIYT